MTAPDWRESLLAEQRFCGSCGWSLHTGKGEFATTCPLCGEVYVAGEVAT